LYLSLNALFDLERADFTARLTNAIFGSLAVAVLFLLAHLLFDRIFAGLSAAILFSVSPVFLAVTTIAKVHGVELFFILTAIYLVFRFHGTKSRVALALSAACIGFSPWVRESALVFIPIYALAYLKPELRFERKPVRLPAYALAPANLAAVLVPLAVVLGGGMYVDILDRI
jgi:predicted membrane-bound mannosyltransferase